MAKASETAPAAKNTFHHPVYCHNCAQAIANKWKALYNDENIVETMKSCGGGRAEGGLCGALYAAIQAIPTKREEIIAKFKAEAGDILCHDLKSKNRTPCVKCIDIADQIVEDLTK